MQRYLTDRTYSEIDLKAIGHNIGIVRELVGKDVKIMCLVKANAYGHGAVEVAKYCENLLDYLGVATVDEGVELRNNGIRLPILVVGAIASSRYADAIRYDLQLTVHSKDSAKTLENFCNINNKIAKVHIALDTGMGRIGFLADELDDVIKICKSKRFDVKGIFTHFSKADEMDKTYTLNQKAIFEKFIKDLQTAGIKIELRHASNSAGILSVPCCNYDMVRMGIMAYGLNPSAFVNSAYLAAALSLKSHIAHIKTLPKGSSVSYGGKYITKQDTVVATVAVGYGDGYPRALSGKGYMLVGGKKAPILGRICMDQTMIDISHIDGVKVGDNVTLIGIDGDEEITVDQLANLAGTINYEIVCGIGDRVRRIYIK